VHAFAQFKGDMSNTLHSSRNIFLHGAYLFLTGAVEGANLGALP